MQVRARAPWQRWNGCGCLAIVLGSLAIAGCTRQRGQYFPFVPGGYWRYDVTVQTVQLTKKSKSTVVGLDPIRFEGRELFRNKINAGTLYYYALVDGYVARVAKQTQDSAEPAFEKPPVIVLPVRPEPGASWTVHSRTGVLETTVDPFRRLYRMEEPVELTFTVASVDEELRVPAGRFSHCVRVEGVGTTSFAGDKTIFATAIDVRQTDWYAPGVGLVKSRRLETTGSKVLPRGEFRMELEEFEF